MLSAHLLKEFGCWTPFSLVHILKPLTDTFVYVGLGGEVEEALVSGSVLDDGFGFAVDGEDDGAARLRANALMR